MSNAWSKYKENYIKELEENIEKLRAKIDHADSTGQPTATYTKMLGELVDTLEFLKQ